MLPALVHDLKRLSKEDCWPLFSKHAFGNRDPNEDSTLKAIGGKIVEKCKGLPLAIQTLGSLLHSQIEAEEWDNVLNSRIWDLPDHKSDVLPALRLSYHYLPSQLKRCFAYCSIFPKGHKFEKRDLVRMWIAKSLLQQPKSKRRKKEVGEQYFNELLSRSPNDGKTHFNSQVFNKLFPVPNCLRVLSLSSYNIIEFLDSVANLKKLHYLDLSGADIGCLPERVGYLHNLETLKSSGCHRLKCLPAELRNLTKLEHLDIKGTLIRELLDSIGNLKQLGYLDLSGTQ
ncbi:PREDICTED: putative disease resistance RPP13-like protein 1 [Theobroma cacao]|uniref:Disease resistance RPP13-like protein 1 n=1 Tax=Theobroma cacao TaxID=3641 RepID=A0AB32UMP9_THECC|nr:PREDICTED: putative disease resistance RPP13-like protein 1 [Theobroma cacao]